MNDLEPAAESDLAGPFAVLLGCGQHWRIKLGAAKPSTHSWGSAVDLNARTTAGDRHPQLVALLEGCGFLWGGRWSGANGDPMHFQYCSGY